MLRPRSSFWDRRRRRRRRLVTDILQAALGSPNVLLLLFLPSLCLRLTFDFSADELGDDESDKFIVLAKTTTTTTKTRTRRGTPLGEDQRQRCQRRPQHDGSGSDSGASSSSIESGEIRRKAPVRKARRWPLETFGSTTSLAGTVASESKEYLNANEIRYQTFQAKDERAYRIVIKGLHYSTDIEEIKDALASPGHTAKEHHTPKPRPTVLLTNRAAPTVIPGLSFASALRGTQQPQQQFDSAPTAPSQANFRLDRLEAMMEKMLD
ncbi:hypothetical protein ACLKA7_004389 [Drosophila subpalustris]